MKTAVSIPDELFAEADRLARRLRRSRSRLYADAVREYLARHDPEGITEALDRVYAADDVGVDPAVAPAGRRALERVEW
jgi:metal-responsive CopG/Arc/MetJ family transcriptional regulator